MSRTTKILFIVLAAIYGAGGLASLAGAAAIRDSWTKLGVSDTLGNVIAVLEVLAAVGLLVGLRRPVVGIAAATGLVALMLGAIVYHVRAEDWAGLAGPVVLGLLAAATVYTARQQLRPTPTPITTSTATTSVTA